MVQHSIIFLLYCKESKSVNFYSTDPCKGSCRSLTWSYWVLKTSCVMEGNTANVVKKVTNTDKIQICQISLGLKSWDTRGLHRTEEAFLLLTQQL